MLTEAIDAFFATLDRDTLDDITSNRRQLRKALEHVAPGKAMYNARP